ncbi:MAG: T9SS type A sorting domain-containing protein [Saprospiraceae bacterium]|nr:T9SS type A sorting domain-containing protein [Saprospiraceae bacterium]
MRLVLSFFSLFILSAFSANAQQGYGNQLIFGRFNSPYPSGTILNFNGDTLKIEPVNKQMEFEGSCAIMCDSVGRLLFYSNGCYIANAAHQVMANGDSIGKDLLEASFCKTGGNPLIQGIIALPKPGSSHLYYLFYTDIGDPYFMQPFFPLAPVTLYFSVIDMAMENGLGRVVEKNVVLLQDTFSRGMIQAARHANGKDWWVIQPKSHSNCYWTFLLTENGVDTAFIQCVGQIWGDNDPQGQAVFSPNNLKYARGNFYFGLSIFDFDDHTATLSNPIKIDFGQDTFNFNGAAFSSNSRFIYAPCHNKLWQFDISASDISSSRILVGELNTPPDILATTRFCQARLAPDGKIYIAGRAPNRHLHVINSPNCYGADCDLQQYALELAARNGNTMPNMPHYKQWSEDDTCETVSSSHTGEKEPDFIGFSPNPATDEVLVSLHHPMEGRWQLVAPSGQVVRAGLWAAAQTTQRIDVSRLGAGVYFFRFVAESGRVVTTRKVVVAR